MSVRILVSYAAIFLLVHNSSVKGQALTDDQERRIKLGVELIKLGCGTGLSQDRTQVSGGIQGWLSLRKLPGLTVGGQADYTLSESQGFVASLAREITDNVARLSIAQLDCMRPYVIRIFTSLYPQETISSQSPETAASKKQMSIVNTSAATPVPIVPTPIVPTLVAQLPAVTPEHDPLNVTSLSSVTMKPTGLSIASTWDETARGKWRIKTSQASCNIRYYTWAFNGDVVEYHDQDNQIDQEKILEIGADNMSTKTLVSQHHDKTGEIPGTIWNYRFFKDGTIGVESSTGKKFVLVRCIL